MWGWIKPFTEAQQQQFQEQVEWKHPEQPVLKSWAIEVRDYDTKGMNYLHAGMTAFLFAGACWLYWLLVKESDTLATRIGTVIGVSIGFALVYFVIYSMCFPTKLLVYRMTSQGFEVAGWSRQAENYKRIFIGTAIVCGIILVMFVAMVPQAIFLVFIGPAGMVLIYISMIGNKQMWEAQRDFSQKEFEWSEFNKMTLLDERSVITFYFDRKSRMERTGKHIFYGKFHIFCPKDCYEELIVFIKSYKLDIPCIKEKPEISPQSCA